MALLDTLELLLDQTMAAKKLLLDMDGVEVVQWLDHSNTNVRVSAARVLSQIVQHPEGKQLVLDHPSDIILRLTHLLTDEEVGYLIEAGLSWNSTLTASNSK